MNNHINNHKNKKGFTIIETLVAIAILMIAIAGPLTVAEKGLSAAKLAHDQVTASYLAQDVLEYVKNVRDDNLLNGRTWLSQFTTNPNMCTLSSPCSVDTFKGNRNGSVLSGTGTASLYINSCNPSGTSCLLYEGQNGYSPDSSTGTASAFSRYFYLTPSSNNGSDEVKVTVVVAWTTGANVGNTVTYESDLFNITK